MSVSSPHPKAPKPYRYGIAERLYLPLFVGLWVTAKHFVRNLLAGGKEEKQGGDNAESSES